MLFPKKIGIGRAAGFATLLLTLVAAIPLTAGVEDDYNDAFNQARAAEVQKDYATAEKLYRRALTDAELFGKDDPRVATTAQFLAGVLSKQKRYTEAEDLLTRATQIFSTNPGSGTVDFGRANFDLAGVLMAEGKYDAAVQPLAKALPIFNNLLDPKDSNIADALCLQGDAFRMLKRYGSAESPLKRCADLRSEDGGVNTVEFGDAANSLALVYEHIGKLPQADTYFKFAAKIRENTLGILSPELADTLEAHAALLRQMGRTAEAVQKEKLAATIRARNAKK